MLQDFLSNAEHSAAHNPKPPPPHIARIVERQLDRTDIVRAEQRAAIARTEAGKAADAARAAQGTADAAAESGEHWHRLDADARRLTAIATAANRRTEAADAELARLTAGLAVRELEHTREKRRDLLAEAEMLLKELNADAARVFGELATRQAMIDQIFHDCTQLFIVGQQLEARAGLTTAAA